MFKKLARHIIKFPKLVIAGWGALVVIAVSLALGLIGPSTLFDRVTNGEPSVPGSESLQGQELLVENVESRENVTLAFRGIETANLPSQVEPIVLRHAQALSDIENVDVVLHPFIFDTSTDAGAASAQMLFAADQQGFLVIVELEQFITEEQEQSALNNVVSGLESLRAAITNELPDAEGLIGANHLIVSAIVTQIEHDLIRGEAIALPIALILMVLVFGGFLAAAMPMVGAIASILTGLGVLFLMTHVMDVDAAVINVITVLGIGLSVDYGLLIVSRFREELSRLDSDDEQRRRGRRRASDVERSLINTMDTAGRTVAFSALTVAVCVLAIAVFSPSIFRAIGFGGFAAIFLAGATALTLVPAIMLLAGRKLIKKGVLYKTPLLRNVIEHTADVTSDEGVFSRLAARVQRRPVIVLTAGTLLLAFLATPVLGLQMRNSGIELLPADHPQSRFVTEMATNYPATRTASITAVLPQTTSAQAELWADEVADLESIANVTLTPVSESFFVVGINPVVPDAGAKHEIERASRAAVTDVRSVPVSTDVYVTGAYALSNDFVSALGERVWIAVTIIVVITFILLFLMTGSVVIPLKALLTNTLSLAATMGILTWVFQQGHLSGLLGFTSAGGLETYVVALVAAFAFGLAMDYEVFLLARIKELFDAGHSNNESVRLGLQRTGRIITSAAAVMAVVFAGFAAGELLVIKQVGFALAVAVVLDATIVRMLMVPATMTLLGRWNWYAPAPLRRLHNRIGIKH